MLILAYLLGKTSASICCAWSYNSVEILPDGVASSDGVPLILTPVFAATKI
jgi:hypothetical protein